MPRGGALRNATWTAWLVAALLAGAVTGFSATPETLRMTGITVRDGRVAVSWQGGSGPFQLLCRTNVAQDWSKLGPVTTASSATNPAVTGPACFYAVTSDLTPPTVPSGVRVTSINSSSVTVRWNAAFDNFGGSGVRTYSVFRNGTFLCQVSAISNSIVDSGLNNLSTYSYAVDATDRVGNRSALSAAGSLVPPVAVVEQSVVAGNIVNFSGAGSWDPDGSIEAYSWKISENVVTTVTNERVTTVTNTILLLSTNTTNVSLVSALPATVSAVPATNTYIVTLRVTDNAGGISPDAVVEIETVTTNTMPANQFPVANAGPDQTGTAGMAVMFSATGSSDPDGTITSYSWNFGDGTTGSGASVSHAYATAGQYNATLTVRDNAGATASDTAVVIVSSSGPNQPPVANAGADRSGNAGAAMTFSAAGSSDPDGTIVSYSWNFGDNTTATGATASHTYANPGSYLVILFVTDNAGAMSADTATITVTSSANQNPVANAGPDRTGTVGTAVPFSASGSQDPDGSIASYSWNFGDGSTGTGLNASHAYASAGQYTVTLTVRDNAGASASDTASVTISSPANQPPIANAGLNRSASVGSPVTFDASGSRDPDGTISSYAWNFGDGTTGSGMSPSHAYAASGTFTATLTVTDNVGATASDTAIVTIQSAANQLPIANAGPDRTGGAGAAVSFDGSGSRDPDGTIVSYSWNFGDGSTGSGMSPSHSYAAAGSFTATLTVTDNAGATASDSAIVTVGSGSLPGTVLWATNIPYANSAAHDIGYAVVTDQQSNVIVGGMQGDCAYLAKFSPSRVLIWSHRFGGGESSIRSVSLDAAGNIFVTGSINRAVQIGGLEFTCHGGYDVLVAKFSPAGELRWLKLFGGLEDWGPFSNERGCSIAVGPDGNPVITGMIEEPGVDFGGPALPYAGGYCDIFLAKLRSEDGTHLWSKAFGSSIEEYSHGLAVDLSGNVFLTGRCSQYGINLGGGPLGRPDGYSMFLAKFSSTGTHLWSRGFGSSGGWGPGQGGDNAGRAVAVDSSGNVVLTGAFGGGGVDFGGGLLPLAAGRQGVFLAKFSGSGGTHIWSRAVGPGGGYGESLTINPSGVISVVGGTGASIMLAGYDPNGTERYSKDFIVGGGVAKGVTCNGSGRVIAAGRFTNPMDLGCGPVTSSGGKEIFVTELVP